MGRWRCGFVGCAAFPSYRDIGLVQRAAQTCKVELALDASPSLKAKLQE